MRLLLSCVLVVLATACSSPTSSSPSSSPSPEAGSRPTAVLDEAAVAQGLAAMYAGDAPDAEDRREGECFAEELLAATTPEQLRDGGLLDASYAVVTQTPTLDATTAGHVADAQLACTDFVADATASQHAASKGELDRRAYAACLRSELDDAAVREVLVASLQGRWDDPALDRLTEAQATCAEQG